MLHKFGVKVTALALALSISSAMALHPVVIKGSKFFDSITRDQFFINGIAYQPRSLSGFSDPLANPENCMRDIPLMKNLGINTIRVYQVDSSLNHDECMRLLEDANMYLILDLAVPQHSIIRDSPEYNTDIWNNVRSSVDAFKDYPNTLGFFIGNEVTNDRETTAASVHVKALLRDTKRHLRATGSRVIPIGYANNDDPDVRLHVQSYFNCGNEDERIDFYGINIYEWCGPKATYANSGYADRTREVESYSVPVFLSEYGCNLVTPRMFNEAKSIFGPEMTSTWSGGIAYEWSEEDINYGLVKIESDNSVTLLQDYHNLKASLDSVHPKGVKMDDFHELKPASSCPEKSPNWQAASTLPPAPSESICECMVNSLSCVASDHVLANPETIGAELNALCSHTSCKDIASDGKNGAYGKYSFCTAAQKLSFMYNYHYTNVGNMDPTTCSFNGNAKMTMAQYSEETCAVDQSYDVTAASLSSVASPRLDMTNFGKLGLLVVLFVMTL